MRRGEWSVVGAIVIGAVCGASVPLIADGSTAPVGVVSHVKVLSDKVPDVSSLDTWKKSYIKEGMSDKEKALAIFNTEVSFQNADSPPKEFLQREDVVLDPI